MQQLKRISVQGKNLPDGRSPKQPRKHNKIKQIKSKIFKNLNQIPIELNHSTKENVPNNQPLRPHSSLLPEDIHFTKPNRANRVQSALSHYPDYRDGNRKRLSLDSTGKRYERDSLASRNSVSKKMSKNNKSIEEGCRVKLAEQRKKSNISCISAYEEGQQRTNKKHSVKQKRPSVSNLHLPARAKDKENKDPKVGKDKSLSKSKNKRKKSKIHLDKSKISTVAISTNDKGFVKKKQSTSTAQIGQIGVVLPKKKKKNIKKKSPRADRDQFQLDQYPINKYDNSYSTEKLPRQRVPLKSVSKSKSRKNSHSKQAKKSSFLEIDYMSCINIPSNSSGLINSVNSKDSRRSNSNIKIIDNWQFRGFTEQNGGSVNFEEIRYYQSFHWSQHKQEKMFMERNFKHEEKYNRRRMIQQEIAEEYPYFGELELKFLTSVIFIQRKWRQYRLYSNVFKHLVNSPKRLSQLSIEQSNSKQLNLSANPKSPRKSQDKPIEEKAEIYQANLSPSKQRNEQNRLNNNIYLDFQEIEESQQGDHDEPQLKYSKGVMKQQVAQIERLRQLDRQQQQANPFSARSSNYKYLQNELFPSITYLLVKKEQLKAQFYSKLCQYSQLERSGAIDPKEYLRLKKQCQRQYQQDIENLSSSKKDLKKGYLKFIDTFKYIKQDSGLRRVSSESGPMAFLYRKIFNLDTHINSPSESSESMKKIAKKVLIRRQFFQTHKIEPAFFKACSNTQSARQRPKAEQPQTFSARLFKRLQFSYADSGQVANQHLQVNRIRQGLVLTPQQNLLSLTNSPEGYKDLNKEEKIKQEQILDEVIITISHELFVELVKIDERRQNCIDIVQQANQIQFHRIRHGDIKDYQIVEESQSLEFDKNQKEDDFQIVEEESKFREIFKIEGLSDRTDSDVSRKHRKSNTYNISPASAEPIPFESEEILHYASELFGFLKKNKLEADITMKLNKNQGFSPREYLKFLRDYQILDEEYQPLISNEVFVDWEDQFYNSHPPAKDSNNYVKRQATTIFHRCVFESVIGLLEQFRPSGEKGQPFPWQNVIYFKRTLIVQDLSTILKSCLSRLQALLQLRCGIIDQKQMILCEQDLQRLHEQNQDKIINMLQRELSVSPHNWYEVEQHSLEIKLQVDSELFEYLMLQALDEILQLL